MHGASGEGTDTLTCSLKHAVRVQFSTAGRDIGTGLLAVDIVSHWTWASILLQCVSYGYFYGATGPYWCAPVSKHITWTGDADSRSCSGSHPLPTVCYYRQDSCWRSLWLRNSAPLPR